MQTKYTVGFSFDRAGNQVVLIRKRRPHRQAGKLNGVGGHVEPRESFRNCMTREYREETGVETDPYTWAHFGFLNSPEVKIAMFMRFNDDIYDVQTMTDEAVETWYVRDFMKEPDSKVMANLRWIIPAAVDRWSQNSSLYLDVAL